MNPVLQILIAVTCLVVLGLGAYLWLDIFERRAREAQSVRHDEEEHATRSGRARSAVQLFFTLALLGVIGFGIYSWKDAAERREDKRIQRVLDEQDELIERIERARRAE